MRKKYSKPGVPEDLSHESCGNSFADAFAARLLSIRKNRRDLFRFLNNRAPRQRRNHSNSFQIIRGNSKDPFVKNHNRALAMSRKVSEAKIEQVGEKYPLYFDHLPQVIQEHPEFCPHSWLWLLWMKDENGRYLAEVSSKYHGRAEDRLEKVYPQIKTQDVHEYEWLGRLADAEQGIIEVDEIESMAKTKMGDIEKFREQFRGLSEAFPNRLKLLTNEEFFRRFFEKGRIDQYAEGYRWRDINTLCRAALNGLLPEGYELTTTGQASIATLKHETDRFCNPGKHGYSIEQRDLVPEAVAGFAFRALLNLKK